jgi:hypothetical protein
MPKSPMEGNVVSEAPPQKNMNVKIKGQNTKPTKHFTFKFMNMYGSAIITKRNK